MSNLAKFRQLCWADRFLLLEATLWLAIARLGLRLMPFRHIAPKLGEVGLESAANVPGKIAKEAERISWAVRALSHRTPWESACLAQAISAKAMLRRRHIPTTLYLGLAKDQSQQMEAHAWLRCGSEIITGKANHERFSVISCFAEQSLEKNLAENEEITSVNYHTHAHLQELLLATLNPAPQKATVGQLAQLDETEWQALIHLAQQQHIETYFLARLEALNGHTAVPTQLLSQLKQRQQQITLQNLAIYRELNLLNRAMQPANIPVVLLKGAFLATAVYPHIGQRAMGDLDLLITQEHIPKMIEILHHRGWQETRPLALEATFEHHHHLPSFAKKNLNFQIEPHWHIILPNRPYSIPSESIWQDVMLYTIAGTDLFAFQPHLQLLHLALHASYNHQFAFDLRSLCDIALVIDHYGDDLSWEKVVENAINWKWQRGVYLTLALINSFWNTAVPPEILHQLKPEQMPDSLMALAKSHLLRGREENKKVSKNFSQLKSNNTTIAKAKFALSFFFPTRKRLAWRYGTPHNNKKIWLYYFVNFYDVIRRNSKRAWLLLRGKNEITKTAERRSLLAGWLGQTE
ncbi:lasso peptide biosynthesis B2 protein [Candidatus Leptofilum sp.]|uniref:lasso peptide biosynthesis B2 protein n=1 Tax=Candidatus Leptofilum sp. TaxID=3241576 RepID=UPI003B5B9426